MSRYLAIDYGTSNTVIALYNEAKNDIELQEYPGISRKFFYNLNGTPEYVHSIPSLIYYGKDERNKDKIHLGNQVISEGKTAHKGAFKWTKRMIASNKRFTRYLDGRRIDGFQAGKDFVRNMLLFSRNVFTRKRIK